MKTATITAVLAVLAASLAFCPLAEAQVADSTALTSVKLKKVRKHAAPPEYRHEISIGWGDQMFETLAWHVTSQPVGLLPETSMITYNGHYRYSQHWFANYRCYVVKGFSFGVMADWSGVWWDEITMNGAGVEQSRVKNRCFQNISIMPEFQVSWFMRKYVSMHSGLALGMDINTGTETDYNGRKTEIAPAAYYDLIGITGQYGRWFATFDYGGLYSLLNQKMIFLVKSRMLSVSVGVRF